MRSFLYELQTYLGLSNPTHSPEETKVSRHSSVSKLMSKYHLKFIKYILSSSKEWTGVGLLNYRDVYLLSNSISRENIEIILSVESVTESWTQQQRLTTVKELPVMWVFWAFVKIPDVDC